MRIARSILVLQGVEGLFRERGRERESERGREGERWRERESVRVKKRDIE